MSPASLPASPAAYQSRTIPPHGFQNSHPAPNLPTVSTRLPPAFPPRWAFFKGLLTGAVIEVPALTGGVWLLHRFGVGDPGVPLMKILRLTTVFCGIAGLFTQGFTVEALQRLLKHPRTGSKGPSASVSLYYLPAKANEIAANPQQYPLYLEISDGRRTVCKMIQLLPEEMTVLRPMFEQQLTPYCEALGQVEAPS
jgi:hypothetical protein